MGFWTDTWNTVTGGARSAANVLPAVGTWLGNTISSQPVLYNTLGQAIERTGDSLATIYPNTNILDRVGQWFGNKINAPGQSNPLGFLEPVVNSPVGGAVAGAANFTQNVLPFRSTNAAVQALQNKNYGAFWGNLGLAGASAAGLRGPMALAQAGKLTPRGILPSLVRENKIGAGLTAAAAGLGALGGASSGAATPGLRAPFVSADAAERRAQAAQGPRIFETADAMERRVINQDLRNRAAAQPDTTAVTGVGAPTGDEMAEYQMYLRQAQEDYERQMADLAEARAMAEEDYRLGTRRSRRGTAGRSANLSALLAAMGLDLSPAAAEGGLQYEAQRGARELAGIERQRATTRTGASRAEAEADAERKRRIAQLNQYLMTSPASRAGNAPPPSF